MGVCETFSWAVVTPRNAEVQLVNQPGADVIFVSLSRVRPSYSEIADVSWSGSIKSQKNKKQSNKDITTTTNVIPRTSGPVTRSMTKFA